jgi:inner membrane protein
MPSPVAHALAGLASGWIVRGNRLPDGGRPAIREAALFAILGMVPDIDLLFGIHRGPTHGLGAAVLAGLAAWVPGWTGRRGTRRLTLAFACVFAYASHTLLDWLASDTSAPLGIMALWPLTRKYYESDLRIFMAISRRIDHPEIFWPQNIAAFARELMILVPLVVVVGWLRRVTDSQLRVAQHPKHHRQEDER